MSADEIAASFKKFDLDDSGDIDQTELEFVLKSLDPTVWTSERISQLWSVIDTDEDGTLSYEEFARWVTTPKRPLPHAKEHELTAEDLSRLAVNFEAFKGRVRRGSIFENSVVPDGELEQCWREETVCHAHGINSERQKFADNRRMVYFGAESLPSSIPIFFACQKGSKGEKDQSPNQDNFSVTYFKNGYTLVCVFDGHGPDGHMCSLRAVQTVPYYLVHSERFPGNMEGALVEAFKNAHSEMVMHSLENAWNVEASGTTAVAAIWKDSTVWMANSGDSRCIVGGKTSKKASVIAQTTDHKPEAATEKARIEASGGEVRSQTFSDGWTSHRIYVKGQNYPGLCMSRTLGDHCCKDIGVIAEPEVTKTEVNRSNAPYLVLASDGIWEFMESDFVVRAFTKEMSRNSPESALTKLHKEARRRWAREEGDYCDDITSVVVLLE